MKEFDKSIADFGFESVDEFNSLVASVDMSTSEKMDAFKEWQHNDGTKEGLMKLLSSEEHNGCCGKHEVCHCGGSCGCVDKEVTQTGDLLTYEQLCDSIMSDTRLSDKKNIVVVGRVRSGKSAVTKSLIKKHLIEEGGEIRVIHSHLCEEHLRLLVGDTCILDSFDQLLFSPFDAESVQSFKNNILKRQDSVKCQLVSVQLNKDGLLRDGMLRILLEVMPDATCVLVGHDPDFGFGYSVCPLGE